MFDIKIGMNIEKIEFHYLFNDNTHSMDAVIRNSCERELLSIIQKISNELELDLSIDSFAYQEGGLKEFYEIITEKAKGNQFLIGIVAGVLITVLSHHLTRDFEMEKLEKEKIELEIQKLRHEINEIDNEQQSEEVLQSVVNIFTQDLKIIKHRSNYYEHLYGYRKIVSIKSQTIDSEGNRSGTYSLVERNDFEKFILDSDELDSEIDSNAVIEIISPVLKKGNYKWKGTYLENGETINFYMKDKDFKNMIVNEGIAFQNGSQIICELEKNRKINEIGEIQITDYSVTLVMEVLNKSDRIITEHSKIIIKERKALKNQLDLGLKDND